MGKFENLINNAYSGLNTSAMQGAGSMGLQNRLRAYELLPESEKEDFMRRSNTAMRWGGLYIPAYLSHLNYTFGPEIAAVESAYTNGATNAKILAEAQRAGATMHGLGMATAPYILLTSWFQDKYNSIKEEAAKRQVLKKKLGGVNYLDLFK